MKPYYKRYPGKPEITQQLPEKDRTDIKELIRFVKEQNMESILATNIKWKQAELEDKKKIMQQYQREIEEATKGTTAEQKRIREIEDEFVKYRGEKEQARERLINMFKFINGYIDENDQEHNIKGLLNLLRKSIEAEKSKKMTPDQWESTVKDLIKQIMNRNEHNQICPVNEDEAREIVARICQRIEDLCSE